MINIFKRFQIRKPISDIITLIDKEPHNWKCCNYYFWYRSDKRQDADLAIWIANHAYGIHMEQPKIDKSYLTERERKAIYDAYEKWSGIKTLLPLELALKELGNPSQADG